MTIELPNQAAVLYAMLASRDLVCGSGLPDNARLKTLGEAKRRHCRKLVILGLDVLSGEDGLRGFRGFVTIDLLCARRYCDRRIGVARRELLRPSWRPANVPSMVMGLRSFGAYCAS